MSTIIINGTKYTCSEENFKAVKEYLLGYDSVERNGIREYSNVDHTTINQMEQEYGLEDSLEDTDFDEGEDDIDLSGSDSDTSVTLFINGEMYSCPKENSEDVKNYLSAYTHATVFNNKISAYYDVSSYNLEYMKSLYGLEQEDTDSDDSSDDTNSSSSDSDTSTIASTDDSNDDNTDTEDSTSDSESSSSKRTTQDPTIKYKEDSEYYEKVKNIKRKNYNLSSDSNKSSAKDFDKADEKIKIEDEFNKKTPHSVTAFLDSEKYSEFRHEMKLYNSEEEDYKYKDNLNKVISNINKYNEELEQEISSLCSDSTNLLEEGSKIGECLEKTANVIVACETLSEGVGGDVLSAINAIKSNAENAKKKIDDKANKDCGEVMDKANEDLGDILDGKFDFEDITEVSSIGDMTKKILEYKDTLEQYAEVCWPYGIEINNGKYTLAYMIGKLRAGSSDGNLAQSYLDEYAKKAKTDIGNGVVKDTETLNKFYKDIDTLAEKVEEQGLDSSCLEELKTKAKDDNRRRRWRRWRKLGC